jgi:predicted cation transporter
MLSAENLHGVLTPGNIPHDAQVPKGRLKDGMWDWTSAVPSGLTSFWRPSHR